MKMARRRWSERNEAKPGWCIYCGRTKDFSKEHYLPRNFGTFRGARTLKERVCRACNEESGKLDEALVRSSPEALFRIIAGVTGRRAHTPVSPFYFDLFSADTVKVLGRHPTYPFEILWEILPGTMTIRELRQVILRREGRIVPLPLPPKDIAEFLKRAIRELELEGAEIIAMFGGEQQGDEEYTAVMDAIKAVADEGKIISITKIEPGQVVPVSAALPITRPYLRAITKIAFHYLVAHNKIFTGQESAFDAAKRFIMADENFDGRIAASHEPVVEQREGMTLAHYGHFLQAEITYTEIVVRAQFFVGPAVSPPTWTVHLAQNPSYVYTDSFGHGFMLFDKPAKDGHQGEMVELTAIRRTLIPGSGHLRRGRETLPPRDLLKSGAFFLR